MTTNAITYYPTLIKSYLVDKTKNSVFNTPIVRTAFVASTVVFTGITTAYFVKKINDTARIALNRPLQTACIAAAIVSTGVVIAHYPISTMILFVGISFILLNRQAYTKIQEINKASVDFFINSPFIKKIQTSFGANPKLVADSENGFPIIQAIQFLDLKELQFKVAQSDETNSNDIIVPSTVTETEEVTSEEEVRIEDAELSAEENKVTDTAVFVVSTLVEETKEVTLEDQSVGTLPQMESIEEVLSEDVTVDNSQSFEEEDITQVVPTDTDAIEEVTSREDNATVVPLSLGLVDQFKSINLNFKNVPARHSSILEAAKTMNQFTLDGTALEKINLAGLDEQGADKACVTLPIEPSGFPSVTTWSNYKPVQKPVKPTLVHPFIPKNGTAANKVVKNAETLLHLLKRLPK